MLANSSLKPNNAVPRRGVFLRLLPACVFLLALCALVTVLYGNGHGSLPPAEQRYSKAKNELDSLRTGDGRASFRESWLRLANEFQEIYDLDPKWANRPAALFRKGESLRELARRSGGRHDYQHAAAAFEEMATRHAESRMAGAALLNSAEIKANYLGDAEGALRLLTRIRTQCARSDALPQALELERKIKGGGASQETPRAAQTRQDASRKNRGELTRIVWKTYNSHHVQIIVELDRNVNWQVRWRQAKNAAGPSSLELELQGALPGDDGMRAGARVADSPLNAVRVDVVSREHTRLFFDFSSLSRYETRVEQAPFRIILDALTQDGRLARRGEGASEKKMGNIARTVRTGRTSGSSALVAVAPRDLGAQLGLAVQSVFLDAGHGGKDPGTTHNGIVEREVALDMVKRVGSLLRRQGIDVQYSREHDMHLSLEQRSHMANKARADVFVSLHVNASPDAQVSGLETYYLDIAGNMDAARLATRENAGSDKKMGDLTTVVTDFMLSARTHESRQMAQTMQYATIARLGKHGYATRNGGVKAAPLLVLIGTGMPAVLVELGYCSNKEESRRLAGVAYRQSLAEGIAEGILAYRNKLLRKQTVDAKATDQPS